MSVRNSVRVQKIKTKGTENLLDDIKESSELKNGGKSAMLQKPNQII